MIELTTIQGETYTGELKHIRLAIWKPKRKEELTLTMDLKEEDLNHNQILSIPLSQVYSLMQIEVDLGVLRR